MPKRALVLYHRSEGEWIEKNWWFITDQQYKEGIIGWLNTAMSADYKVSVEMKTTD